MKNFAIKGFAMAALAGAAMILGPVGGIVGLSATQVLGAGAFSAFIGIAAGGAIGYGLTAALSQIKLKNKTILDYAIT